MLARILHSAGQAYVDQGGVTPAAFKADLPAVEFAPLSKKQPPSHVIWACPAPARVERLQGPLRFLAAWTASLGLGVTAAARIDLEGLRDRKGLTAAMEAAARLTIESLLLQHRLLASELDGRGIAFLVHEGHVEVEGKTQVPTVTGKADDGVVLKQESKSVYGCRITDELRQEIHDAARGGPMWVDHSRDGILFFTTSGDIAFRRKELDLVNASHPLVRAAVKKVQPQVASPLACLGQATLRLGDCGDGVFRPGIYFLLVFAHTISSIRSRRVLETVAWGQEENLVLDSEVGERLLYLVIEKGREWDQDEAALPIPRAVWQTLTSEARRRNRALYASEERENRALYVRRRNALQAEHEHDLTVKQRRLQTARERGSVRIIPAMQGQIAKAESDFRLKLEELDQMQVTRASLSDPLSACVVFVTC